MKTAATLISSCLLVIPLCCPAQIDISIGPQLNFPLMYNDMVGDYHHTLGSLGPRVSINYVPNTTSFYPSLSVNVASAILPLLKVDNTVISMRFIQANITLSAKARKQLNNNREIRYGIGLGASYLQERSVITSGNNNDLSVSTVSRDSGAINSWSPAINVEMEYVIPISTTKPWFAGLGFNLQYIHFFDHGAKYNIAIFDSQYNWRKYEANLKGEVFTPGFYISFYYKLGQKAYNY
jgi:hypothetical protein